MEIVALIFSFQTREHTPHQLSSADSSGSFEAVRAEKGRRLLLRLRELGSDSTASKPSSTLVATKVSF